MASEETLEENASADQGVVGKPFHTASLGRRALIVFAGPATNLLLTIGIFAAFFMFWGKPVQTDPAETNVVNRFAEESVAREAGMMVGDRIIAINGEDVATFDDITSRVVMYPDKRITIGVEREGERLSLPVQIASSVEQDRFGNESRVGRIGVYSNPIEFEPTGPIESVTLATEQSWRLVQMMVTGVAQIVTGERSVKELGGPIKIAKYSGEQFSLGPMAFVNFMALISLNLAFINLLPIPALDGGHLAFYAAEAVRRKPVGPRGQEWAFRTGIALVLALMLFVTINDLISLPFFSS